MTSPEYDEVQATQPVVSRQENPQTITTQKSHQVLAHQRDGESRVFDYAIVKYGRRSRGV